MRNTPYTGPTDTNDFDHLTPDEAARRLYQYRLLGDCFELSNDEDMFGRGYLIEDWKTLIEDKKASADRAQLERLDALGAVARSTSAVKDGKAFLADKEAAADRTQRELAAAAKLARVEGAAWSQIGELVGMSWREAEYVYGL